MSEKFDCVLNLRRGSTLIGNMLVSRYLEVFPILSFLNNCMKNFNRCLISSKVPDAILAHRFFDAESIACDRGLTHEHIMQNSFKHVLKEYPYYTWPIIPDQVSTGKIALVKGDMEENDRKSNCSITINLSSKAMSVHGLFDILSDKEYCERKGIPKESFSSIKFKQISFSPTLFSFNDFSDLLDATKERDKGFIYFNDKAVFVPK